MVVTVVAAIIVAIVVVAVQSGGVPNVHWSMATRFRLQSHDVYTVLFTKSCVCVFLFPPEVFSDLRWSMK